MMEDQLRDTSLFLLELKLDQITVDRVLGTAADRSMAAGGSRSGDGRATATTDPRKS